MDSLQGLIIFKWKMTEIPISVRAHAINLLATWTFLLLFSFNAMAFSTITLNSPADRNMTNVTTPSFNFTVVGNESTYNATLYLNNECKGNNASVSNNTATIITSTALGGGMYSWNVNASKGNITNTSDSRIIFILDISSTSNITITSWSGNLTHLQVCYTANITANVTANISALMHHLDGECNYGVFSVSNLSNSIIDIRSPRNLSSMAECQVILTANITSGSYCVWIQEDEQVSRGNLASIIASAAVAIVTILHALKWDSHTRQ